MSAYSLDVACRPYHLGIIIPTYSEADSVGQLLPTLHEAVAKLGVPVEVLFVDDSHDHRTIQAIDHAAASLTSPAWRIRTLHREGSERRGGLGGAIIAGLHELTASLVMVMDADLQHPPEFIPEIVQTMTPRTDLVIPTRYRPGGSAPGLGRLRRAISWGSTWVAKVLFPFRLTGVTDPMSGWFLIRRSSINLTTMRPIGFKILLEILVRTPGLKIKEVPYRFDVRTSGQSKGTLKQGLTYLRHLVVLRMSSSRAAPGHQQGYPPDSSRHGAPRVISSNRP